MQLVETLDHPMNDIRKLDAKVMNSLEQIFQEAGGSVDSAICLSKRSIFISSITRLRDDMHD